MNHKRNSRRQFTSYASVLGQSIKHTAAVGLIKGNGFWIQISFLVIILVLEVLFVVQLQFLKITSLLDVILDAVSTL